MADDQETAYGVAAWSSAWWREAAVSWLDEQLVAAGIERTGEVEQPRVRPWSTILTAPTTAGAVWCKATAARRVLPRRRLTA